MPERLEALVIGGGPAGLMAAEALADAGRAVVLCEAMPSVGRKLLMAGKSGLNITKDEPADTFAKAYSPDWLRPMLSAFGPQQVAEWCRGLGQEVFTGSSGRVFPRCMKASPLLRAWLGRLAGKRVEIRTRWRWLGPEAAGHAFQTPAGRATLRPRVTVLALGGASWARLGPDGAWVPWLTAQGVEVAPFRPANMGFNVAWSRHMQPHFGRPIKGAALWVDGQSTRGEFVLTASGVEGGGIYAVSRALRDGAGLTLDLLPDLPQAALALRLSRLKPGETAVNKLRKLGLSPAAIALVMDCARGEDLSVIKRLPIPLQGPRPLDEAISVAGGISRAALTDALELRAMPGTFACGEMLDWEAPTGGYLLTACLATGLWAGLGAGPGAGLETGRHAASNTRAS